MSRDRPLAIGRIALVALGCSGTSAHPDGNVINTPGGENDHAADGLAVTETVEAGGRGGASGDGGASTEAGCPGTGGPSMVRLPLGYCIDITEVTRGQYQAWLNTNPSTSEQIPVCQWNTTFVPTYDWPPTTALDNPVASVDWCDAYAFCVGVGKQMCGTVGGRDGQPALGQWAEACSSGGRYVYPYGDQYRPDNCAGPESKMLTTVPVGTMPLCQSSVTGYQGVFDLSGNVSEWQDYCESGTVGGPQYDRCVAAGGNFSYDITTDTSSRLRCEGGDWVERRVGSAWTGIRCCSAN